MRTALLAIVQAATLPLRKAIDEFYVTERAPAWRAVCIGGFGPIYFTLKLAFFALAAGLAALIFGTAAALALSVGCCLGSPEEVIEMLLFLGFKEEELPLLRSSGTDASVVRSWKTLPRLLALLHALEAVPMVVLQVAMVKYTLDTADARVGTVTPFMWFSLLSSIWFTFCKVSFTMRYGFSLPAFARFTIMNRLINVRREWDAWCSNRGPCPSSPLPPTTAPYHGGHLPFHNLPHPPVNDPCQHASAMDTHEMEFSKF